MFSYFQETNGYNGLHLAYSLDGLSYHAVNGNNGIVQDIQSTPFMRDPYINYTNGTFHLTYTTGWTGSTIGYSSSTDLLNWSTPEYKDLPITNGQERWAPQIYYDSDNSRYMVYWATRIGTSGYLAMYYSTTTDFNTFSTPTLLYSRSNAHTLDGDIVKNASDYTMFIAGTAVTQGGTNLYGPYAATAEQITSGYASEGPSAIKIGDTWLVYNDHYTSGVYGAMASTDNMETWTEYTGYVSFPSGTRHGNVFTVPLSVAQDLAANAAYKPAEDEFIGAAGTTDFHTASNWFAQSVPGSDQTPVIQGGHTVDMNSSPSGTLTGLKVGQTSNGTLNISLNSVVIITSSWPNGLVLGERVTGNGTIVQSGNSSVTVNGYAPIGTRGHGTYRLQSGELTVNGDLNIGDILGSQGELYQESGTITASALYVGSAYDDGFTTGNALGEVFQSGGTVNITGSGDVAVIGGRFTAYGVGTYELSGTGTLNAGSSNIVVGGYGQGTLTQSGGTLNAGRWLSIGRYSGSTGSYSISSGTLYQTRSSRRIIIGEEGAGTLTVSGNGLVDSAGGLRVSGSATGSGEVHLDGGAIFTTFIEDGGGTSQFHFNGGTLKARNSTSTFMQGLDLADVETGGAIINTNGYDITIAQSLLAGSPSGGLTKEGSGLLILTSAPTYTGDTVINNGQLQLLTGTTTLAGISGAGELLVGDDTTSTQLTASSITVGTLTIAANSKVSINPLADQSSLTPVPEPGAWLLLLLAAALFCIKRR